VLIPSIDNDDCSPFRLVSWSLTAPLDVILNFIALVSNLKRICTHVCDIRYVFMRGECFALLTELGDVEATDNALSIKCTLKWNQRNANEIVDG